MFTILLHSSKTMRPAKQFDTDASLSTPLLLSKASELNEYLKTLTPEQLESAMNINPSLAEKTHSLIQNWSDKGSLAAIDIFLGDIYSGFQTQSLSEDDRKYAHEHLYILSGLYGVLRALDGIRPYRLEMGYKLPDIKNLYDFWGDAIAQQLPSGRHIVNLSAVEYTKAVFPHLKKRTDFDETLIITPKFMTISPKTGQPTFVTVHAKVARGAFARWIIQKRIECVEDLVTFSELGYVFDEALSSLHEPVFIAREFKGIGLSVRLT